MDFTDGGYGVMGAYAGPDIVENGLLLCLDAGNPKSYPGSGNTWTDLSGNGNTGTLSTTSIGYNSANGGSLVFDGTDDQVSVSASFTVTASTWIVWMRRNGIDGYDGILFSRGTTKTIGINFLSGGPLSYTYSDTSPGPGYNWNSGLIPPDSAWSMVAFTFTSTGATAYLYKANELNIASNNYNHPSVLVDGIRVGNDSALAGRFYQGRIAQALIYNRALSAAEIQQNFNATRSRYSI